MTDLQADFGALESASSSLADSSHAVDGLMLNAEAALGTAAGVVSVASLSEQLDEALGEARRLRQALANAIGVLGDFTRQSTDALSAQDSALASEAPGLGTGPHG